MNTANGWQPMADAPRDGRRILVAVYSSEQWPAEVEMVRWGEPGHGAEKCWVAADSGARGAIIFGEGELAFWMPLPEPPAGI